MKFTTELEGLRNEIKELVAKIMDPRVDMDPEQADKQREYLGIVYESKLASLRKLKPDLTCDFFKDQKENKQLLS